MLTAGLLLNLKDGDATAAAVTCELQAHAAFQPGMSEGRWLPVVMEAADDAESRTLHDWVAALPGVAFVDVVHVNFDELPTALN